MSWKDLFIKAEEDAPDVRTEVAKPSSPRPLGNVAGYASQGIIPVTQPAYTPSSYAPTSGQDYTAMLEESIRKANQTGPGYLEFSNALKTMENIPLAENQKYIATFAGFAAMKLTPSKLVESAQEYLTVLDGEEKDFSVEMQASISNKVEGSQNEIDRLQKENEELTRKLQENTQKVGELNVQKSTASLSLQTEQQAFTSAMGRMKGLINEHIQKIKQYLDANTTK